LEDVRQLFEEVNIELGKQKLQSILLLRINQASKSTIASNRGSLVHLRHVKRSKAILKYLGLN
jgi:hypothetical protein